MGSHEGKMSICHLVTQNVLLAIHSTGNGYVGRGRRADHQPQSTDEEDAED